MNGECQWMGRQSRPSPSPFSPLLARHLVKRQIPQLPLDNRMKDRDGSQGSLAASEWISLHFQYSHKYHSYINIK